MSFKDKRQRKIIFVLSVTLVLLLIVVSSIGFFTRGFYSAETANWQVQSRVQDMIDLFFITPFLVIISILVFRNHKNAFSVWGGIILYLIYTFVLYCFDVHFNKLFLLYCTCLGVAFYSFVSFLYTEYKENYSYTIESKILLRGIGIYFLVISTLFYSLWLSEIIPSTLQDRKPASLTETGLFTNGVHVIDLAVFLPGIFFTGILLLKRKLHGFIFTPVLLTFFILMDITIGVMAMKDGYMLTLIMGVLTLISMALLILYFIKLKNISSK